MPGKRKQNRVGMPRNRRKRVSGRPPPAPRPGSSRSCSTLTERTLTSASAPPMVWMRRTEQDILIFSKTVEYSARRMPTPSSSSPTPSAVVAEAVMAAGSEAALSYSESDERPLAANNSDKTISSTEPDCRICVLFLFLRLLRFGKGLFHRRRRCLLPTSTCIDPLLPAERISRASCRDIDRTLASALHFPYAGGKVRLDDRRSRAFLFLFLFDNDDDDGSCIGCGKSPSSMHPFWSKSSLALFSSYP